MKIAYVHDMPLPTTGADSEQVINTVAALGRAGVDVTLVVPGHSDRSAPTAHDLRAEYGIDGPFDVVPIPGSAPAVRVLAKPIHAWKGTLHRVATTADLVYTRNLATVVVALARGHRVVYEHFRPWGDQFPPLQPLLRTLFRQPRFVGGILHSGHTRDSFLRLGIAPERLLVAHNGFHPQVFSVEQSPAEARTRLGLPAGRPIVTYAGTINPYKGLDIVLAMARRLPTVQFLLVGSTGLGPVEAEAAGIENATVVPRQRPQGMASYLVASDVLLLPPSLAPLQRNTVLPLKLFGYLAAGRAILGPRSPDTAEILRSGENAELVEPGNLDQAVERLATLLGDDARRARLGQAAKVTSVQFTWDARAERIKAFLERRLSEGPGPAPHADPWRWGLWCKETLGWLAKPRPGRSNRDRRSQAA